MVYEQARRGDAVHGVGVVWQHAFRDDILWRVTSNCGTVFQIYTDGTGFAVLKHCTPSDGANPRAMLTLSGTTLYGTTYSGGASNYGTVFRINTDGAPQC